MTSSSRSSSSALYPLFRKASEIYNDENNDNGDSVSLNSVQKQQNKRARIAQNDAARANAINTARRADNEPPNTAAAAAAASSKSCLKERKEPTETMTNGSNANKEENETVESQQDDKVAQQQLHRQRNVLYQLVHRSTTGRRLLTNPPPAHATWSPWALLDTTSSSTVTCTAWDHVGVLLAVACTNRTVRIYDWDVVSCKKQRRAVEPMCVFSTPRAVTSLQWNEHDCLAVCMRGSSTVRVYDVARLVETSSNATTDCFANLQHASCKSEAVAVTCLSPQKWLVSFRNGTVALFQLKATSGTTVSLVWKWNYSNHHDYVTDMIPLKHHTKNSVLLIGTTLWVQLDWKNCTRLAFSTVKTPTVLQRWNLPACSVGSVASLQVVTETPLCLKWITFNGWILSINLDSTTQQPLRPRVLHKPPRVMLQTSSGQGDSLTITRKESTQHYSQPLQPVAAYSTTSLLTWQTVPTVTHVLPHHDRRNVGGSLQVVHSPTKSLSIMDAWNRIVELAMSTCTITTVTLHPSNEWLVVGDAHGQLQVWTARKVNKRRKKQAQTTNSGGASL